MVIPSHHILPISDKSQPAYFILYHVFKRDIEREKPITVNFNFTYLYEMNKKILQLKACLFLAA